MMKSKIILFLFIFSIQLTSQNKIIKKDFGKYFKDAGSSGCFILYDKEKGDYIIYNSTKCKKRYNPASTFKILNSLIGLESGVISDENFIIRWDSVDRKNPDWNKDHDLKSAIKFSAVWYYQELARRVGEERMIEYLRKANYGNMDISGGVDKFWLSGGLKISPLEQIEFIKKFYDEKLPFSKRNHQIVKKIILREDSVNYKLYGKTGMNNQGEKLIGWFVGFIEKNNEVYFFTIFMEDKSSNPKFAQLRIEIAKKILKQLQIL